MENNQDSKLWDSIYENIDYAPIAPYTDAIAFLARIFLKRGEGKRLLEIGCGVGQNIAYARWTMGFDIYGVDYSAQAIELARISLAGRGVDAELHVGDVTQLPYANGFFDVCIERAVIQQNRHAAGIQIVKELLRVLRPGGYLCCSIIAEGHQLYGNGEYLGNGDFHDPGHDGSRHFYARRDIMDLFSGFDLLRLSMHTRQNVMTGQTNEQYWVVEARKPETTI
jgi:SAM-dependent methyltransferase